MGLVSAAVLGLNKTCRALIIKEETQELRLIEQSQTKISPLSFGLDLMFPTQRGFRGRNSPTCVLTLVHNKVRTLTQTRYLVI